MDTQEIGKKLKFWRTRRLLSQEALSALTIDANGKKINADTICSIEKAKHPPRKGTLKRLLAALNITPDDFFDTPLPEERAA
jgi:transcriptional regulator with XRE-family HTH domain